MAFPRLILALAFVAVRRLFSRPHSANPAQGAQ